MKYKAALLRWGFLAAVVSPFAVSAQEAKESALNLKDMRWEVRVEENLAMARLVMIVRNPSGRSLEGDVRFSVPEGAAVCDATLLENISTPDRRARVFSPEDARYFYSAVRERGVTEEEWESIDAALANGGIAGDLASLRDRLRAILGSAGGSSERAAQTQEGRNSRSEQSDRGLGSAGERQAAEESREEARKEAAKSEEEKQKEDPALLEWVSDREYRLRFYPVPPYQEQTVTLSFAFEVPMNGNTGSFSVPLRIRSNFWRTSETRSAIRVDVNSRDALGVILSRTHSLPPNAPGKTARYTAGLPLDGTERELHLAYVLSPKSPRKDFGRAVDWSSISAPPLGKVLTMEEAERAVLALRALEALSARRTTTSEAEFSAVVTRNRVVSRYSSLLVIDRWMVRELERNRPKEASSSGVAAATELPADFEECDYLRQLLRFPADKREQPCARHFGQSDNPSVLRWAESGGFLLGPSAELPGFMTYAHVVHRKGCPVTERRVAVLQALLTQRDRK